MEDPTYIDEITFENEIEQELNSERKIIFLLDDFIITNFEDFKSACENEYTKEYYTPNAIIRFKIKLTPKKFIILQNALFPRLVELNQTN